MYAIREFSLTQKTYCIQRGNKHVCAFDTRTNLAYAIGFHNSIVARNIMYEMDPDPSKKIQITRSGALDVAKDINKGLSDLSVSSDFKIDSFIIDMSATIIIPKNDNDQEMQLATSLVPDAGFHISTLDTSDFLLYPFSNSIGIALPLYVMDEDEQSYCMKTVIVESSYCAPMTHAALKRMMK